MAENSMTVVADRFSDRFRQEAWFALPRHIASNVDSRDH